MQMGYLILWHNGSHIIDAGAKMELANIAKIAGLVGFILYAIIERAFLLLKQQQDGNQKQSQDYYRPITICWYGAIFYSLLDAFSLRWTMLGKSFQGVQLAGIFLIVLGLLIRSIARKDLGKQYSTYVETSAEHRLVTGGIYHRLRHPAYLGLICLFIGIPVCEGSLGGILIALVGGIPLILKRIQIEEKALSTWFGEEYEGYKSRSWRLIPGVW